MTDCFVHIPKTAGSTVLTLITQNYAPTEAASIYGDFQTVFARSTSLVGRAAGYKLIHGHFPYGTHLNLGLRAARYFFFLRHPVERHFSDVAHGLREARHGAHSYLTAPGSGPSTWATVSDKWIGFRNTTTHYLSGAFFSKEIDLTDFHRAAQAVQESEFVGISERFNESVLIMARKLGWSKVLYEKVNVASNPLKDVVTPALWKACESRLSYDLGLYEIARERFDRDARSYGSLLREAASQLKELVDLQIKAFPDLDKTRYFAGDPLPFSQRMGVTYRADSPLALWVANKTENRQWLAHTLANATSSGRQPVHA
jgi:hypothetical protein